MTCRGQLAHEVAAEKSRCSGHGHAHVPLSFVSSMGLFTTWSLALRLRVGVPHFHRAIRACRGEAFSIGTEAHAVDLAAVSPEREGRISRLRVPHLHCPIKAPRHDALAVGA